MTEVVPIYIPTYRRVDRQITARWIPKKWPVFLVARPDEATALRRKGHFVMECPLKGIGPTRQWIIENHAAEIWGDKLFMMDDDLRFYVRREDDPTKFRQLCKDRPEPEAMNELLFRLVDLLDESPLVGVTNRSGANRDTSELRKNTRMHDLFGIDLTVTRKHGFRIDRIAFMEDFDFILQHLTAGYDTVMLNTHCKGDVGSNADGGCSVYRDLAGQELAARALVKRWPDFVKLRKVSARGEGEWAERVDVTVQWAKARKSAR